MTTWIDVADSAVKIGLGAFIGWLGTYWTTRLTHKHEIVKEQRARRREMLESVATQVESYFGQVVTAFAYIRERYEKEKSGSQISDEFLNEFRKKVEPIKSAIDIAGAAEAKLLLLQQTECADNVRKLYVLSDEYMQILLRSYNEVVETKVLQLPVSELESKARQMGDVRRNLLSELAKSYDKF